MLRRVSDHLFNPYPANVENRMPANGRWDLTRRLEG